MSKRANDLEMRIRNTRRLLERAEGHLVEMRYVRDRAQHSQSDCYREEESWTVEDELKTYGVRLVDKERQVRFLRRQLAALETEFEEREIGVGQ